jgi:ApeA N-terminal domain 1
MLFTLPTIESNFAKCIQSWIKKYELLEPAINLYFSVLYNPSNYAEVKFLSLTQAIETYHRRLFDEKYQNDDIYRAGLYSDLIKVLPKELDSDFKKSLEGRLKYGNEYSLRTRLRKVVESITDILDFSFVQLKQERTVFINRVVDTRNYWTHYSSELAEKAVQTGEERLILITQLQLLLEVCFLKDLGFDTDVVSKLIKRSYRYKLLKNRKL